MAALLFSLNPAWTPDQVRLFLLATAQPIAGMNGYGVVDASAALNAAKTVLAGGPLPALPDKPSSNAASLATNLDSVLAYPNPWRSDRHSGIPIAFDNLTADSTVKIFTISAYLVKTLTPVQGRAGWDLKNDAGDTVASGIYIYSITDGQGNRSQGKLAVIR